MREVIKFADPQRAWDRAYADGYSEGKRADGVMLLPQCVHPDAWVNGFEQAKRDLERARAETARTVRALGVVAIVAACALLGGCGIDRGDDRQQKSEKTTDDGPAEERTPIKTTDDGPAVERQKGVAQ